MKRALILSVLILSVGVPASAQSVLRQRLEQAGNEIGQLFSNDKYGAELRSLRGAQALKVNLVNQKRVEIETLTLELEQIERRLIELGEVPYLPAVPVQPTVQVQPIVPGPIITCELLANGQCAPTN